MGLEGAQVAGEPQLDSTLQDSAEPDQQGQQPAAGDGATSGANAQPKQPLWTPADTQASQQLAAIKRELGLPKNARLETVREAIGALRQPQQSADWDNLEPEVAARVQDYEQRLWSKNEELYGDVFVPAARELYQQTLKERDPDKFVQSVLDFVLAVTEGDEDEEGEPDQQQPPEATMPELGNADVPVAQRTNADPTGGRRDSGDMVGFVRNILRLPTPPPRS